LGLIDNTVHIIRQHLDNIGSGYKKSLRLAKVLLQQSLEVTLWGRPNQKHVLKSGWL